MDKALAGGGGGTPVQRQVTEGGINLKTKAINRQIETTGFKARSGTNPGTAAPPR
jgi:hypothetical protein